MDIYNVYIRLLLQGKHGHLLGACQLLRQKKNAQHVLEKFLYNKLLGIILSVKRNQHIVRQNLPPNIKYLK